MLTGCRGMIDGYIRCRWDYAPRTKKGLERLMMTKQVAGFKGRFHVREYLEND